MLAWQWTEAPQLGPTARVIAVRCHHGHTSVAMVPGRTPSANLAVLDIVRVRHSLRHGCDCAGLDRRSVPRDQPTETGR